MMDHWTSQRVLELAPDAASATAGRSQANVTKWTSLGHDDVALWGEVQGSGKRPYQVRVDLREPAFKCSCPSRKFPCKHSLGILLLWADRRQEFAAGPPPDWVAEWLASREQRARDKQQKAASGVAKPVDVVAQAKRSAKREANVRAGVEQLRVWLTDLARQGFAWAQSQPNAYWATAAARMVDFQAPGLARRVRELGDSTASGAGWQQLLLSRMARLHLALEGYSRLDALPSSTRDDLRAYVGWTTTRDALAEQPIETGVWTVAGVSVEQEDQLTVQRTWLVRHSDGRPALLLDFAAPGQTLTQVLACGSTFPASLTYYPGSEPLRAALQSRDESVPPAPWPAHRDLAQAFGRFAAAVTAHPWQERWPMSLDHMRLLPPDEQRPVWRLADRQSHQIALASGKLLWQLLSVSGGHEFLAFGEWDGSAFDLHGAWIENAYYSVSRFANPPSLVRSA
ncbi:MAG: SWIM zinc finger family protein [Planctomycetales bacterium]|nr:SWIM zinc finger family protein [Planctomycetales bacterium]